MSIASLLLAIWLILVGATWLTWLSIDSKALGLLAFITGVVWLIDGFRPLNIPRP